MFSVCAIRHRLNLLHIQSFFPHSSNLIQSSIFDISIALSRLIIIHSSRLTDSQTTKLFTGNFHNQIFPLFMNQNYASLLHVVKKMFIRRRRELKREDKSLGRMSTLVWDPKRLGSLKSNAGNSFGRMS